MRTTALLISAVLLSAPAVAIEWSACSSALDTLQHRGRDSEDAAAEADTASDAFREAQEDLQSCRRSPDVYDHLGDHCQSKKDDLDSAKNELESAAQQFEGEADRLRRALREVEGECEVDFGRGALSRAPRSSFTCDQLRAIRGTVKPESLDTYCQTLMSASECKACLSSQ